MNKVKLKELIEVFYQQPFKIFYVNSLDSVNFIKPTGLFISLGISTSEFTMNKLKTIIENTYPESCPRIAELMSIRTDSGDFLNTITNNHDPKPYKLDEEKTDLVLLDKTSAEKELSELREQLINNNSVPESVLIRTQKLLECIEMIHDRWEENRIQKRENDEYKIFHLISNYKKDKNDVEYRIGIFVL